MVMSKTGKAVNGLLLLNKAQGITSNVALQQVKRLFQAQKAGHTGSLDPLATGMLPICFGEAAKFCQYLLDADKSYLTTGQLGIQTDTGDADGQEINRGDFSVSEAALEEALKACTGAQAQIPPMYSALKHQGRPLYELARAGLSIERQARMIHIHSIKLLSFDGLHFSLEVRCSKGTYIRTLVEDIAKKLHTYAHVTRLHRLYSGNFAEDPMHTLEELQRLSPEHLQQMLLPMDRIVNYLPSISLTAQQTQSLQQGKSFQAPCSNSGVNRLYTAQGEFLGLGEVTDAGELKTKRLISF